MLVIEVPALSLVRNVRFSAQWQEEGGSWGQYLVRIWFYLVLDNTLFYALDLGGQVNLHLVASI